MTNQNYNSEYRSFTYDAPMIVFDLMRTLRRLELTNPGEHFGYTEIVQYINALIAITDLYNKVKHA